jgi:hypothetical protein
VRIHRLAFVLFAWSTGLTVTAAAEAQTSSPSRPPAGASSADGTLTVAGEHFTVRRVIDHQQNDLVAEVFQAPQSWTDRSDVRWNPQFASSPVNVVVSVENPANQEGLFIYPAMDFIAIPGVSRQGQARTGQTWASPMPPAQALSVYVQQARGSLPQFHVVGSRDAPGLPELREMDASQHPYGVTMRVAYELQGKPMEEDFYAAYHLANVCSNVPGSGRACETDWGLYAPHSFRAPAGTLDRRVAVFAAIQSSFRQNPAWAQRAGGVRAQLMAQVTHSIDARADQLREAKARTAQIVANSNASLAASDRRTMAIRSGGSGSEGGSAGRSSADKADDNIRGVTTLDDPNGGTTQRSNSQQYHWTDGNGNYRDSNDPSYNPNNTENGSWHIMNESR